MNDEQYKRKLETVAKNYAQQDCDINMLKRLAEDIYISGFKRGIEKEKLAKSKPVTNSHDFDQWWSDYITSHTTEKDTDENASNKVVNFKPGDKFILELGKERRMFDEFEIAGTDLYVKTDLLEKLTWYEPDTETVTNCHDLTGDTISRQAAIDAISKCSVKEVTPAFMLVDKAEVMTEFMMLPSAQPELATDCISKQSVIDAITDENIIRNMDSVIDSEMNRVKRSVHRIIASIPSAQPECKTGRWIRSGNKLVPYYCSSCTGRFDYEWKFCPNCGAKMLKDGESDDS